jgi:hypothetical protein
MQFTAQSNGHKEQAMAALLDRSYMWFAVSVCIAFFSGVSVQPNAWVTVGAISLAVICAVSALYLLRYYNYWYSWLWWLPVLPAFSLVVEPMRNGALSVLVVPHGLALGSSLMFGAFWYFRKGLRKWAS